MIISNGYAIASNNQDDAIGDDVIPKKVLSIALKHDKIMKKVQDFC